MTNREAMEIVLELARKGSSLTDLSIYVGSDKALEAANTLEKNVVFIRKDNNEQDCNE
jgi:hypothetical protein|tara:strand:+ start:403 stop:576 length:174 start_codon:yes stop_codon:yes gene_type:complete